MTGRSGRTSGAGKTRQTAARRTGRGQAGGGAAEAARAAVDLEPDLAPAIVAVHAPPACELGEQAQAEALGVDAFGIEPVALVGDLHPGEILSQAGEEHDALVRAKAGMAHGVADDLGRQQRDGVLDVLVQAARPQRAAREAG